MHHREAPKKWKQVIMRLVTMMFALLATGTVSTRAVADQPAQPPNIVLILSDDHRFDVMGCAGHPIVKTPNMDRLAAAGVRFTNAFVTTSICAASRATYFTGLYERTHKYTFRTPPLAAPLCHDSYPAVLKRSGYQTGFVGKFSVAVDQASREKMFDYFQPVGRTPYFKKTADGSTRHATEIIGDHAIEFLKDQAAETPFCLSMSFNAPHAEDADKDTQYPSPKSVDGMYEDISVPPPALNQPGVFESQPDFLKNSLNRQRWYWRWDTPKKYQRNVKAYFRMISGIDQVVGRVLQQLEDQNQAQNTIVIFCGDNGYYLGSRGFAGKWSHYDESLRIPLIVFDPRANATNHEVHRTVLNVDVPSTILDLAGVTIPDAWQGQSLATLMDTTGQPISWRDDFFCEHLMHFPGGIPKWEGVRGARWMYARYFEQEPVFEFLHDLQADPDQLINLAGDPAHRTTLETMRIRCDELRTKWGG